MDDRLKIELSILVAGTILAAFGWFIRGSFVTHHSLRPITAEIWRELRKTQTELAVLQAVLADRAERK